MDKLKVLLIFSFLITSTLQNPLKSDDIPAENKSRAEEKNWKINSGYYEEKSIKNGLNDDSTYRLPNDTLPIRYDIYLKTDVDKSNFDFDGRVTIDVHAVEQTNTITLQYRDITISKVSLMNISTDEVLADELNFDYVLVYEFLKIELPRTLLPNDEVRLEITYNGTLKTNNAGFYRAYYTMDEETVYYAVTQFESTDARHAFPCYDEPAIRAPIGLQIQHDKSYSAYSNMPLIETIPVEGTDYLISKFDDTPPVQTYLLAFLISPFDFVSNNDPVIPQRIFAKPTSIANGDADFALSIADPIIKKLVNHFGVNYTLPKLDHAAITQFAAGAMENWGFVTYAERYLLATSTSSSTARKNIIATMAHEDAHMFFGNLVAPHWWSDLWLNEGFATLYEYFIPHLLYPEDGWMEDFRTGEINYSFNYDVLSRSAAVPMHNYVETPAAIDARFNSISYTKSGVVLNMFREALSDSTFTKGLRKYLNKMSLKAATPQDLFASIQEAFDEDWPENNADIDRIMSSWVYQAGYPLVSISRTQDGVLVLTQRRYPEAANNEVYSIPLSFATKSQPNFDDKTVSAWMLDQRVEIPQESFGMTGDDWIVLNIQQTGYYRVTYSSDLWKSIAKGLQTNHRQFNFVNRRVLQTELMLGYSTLKELMAADVLEVLSYLVNENEFVLWTDARPALTSLNTTLFGTDLYPEYLNFVKSITQKQLELIGLEAIEDEPTSTRSLRNQVKTLNCYALDDDCLNHELQKLILYTEDAQENAVPDFCSGFRNANPTIYEYYLNEIAGNLQLPLRSRIISSIGCSLDENLLRLITLIVEDTTNVITSTERTTIINNMLISSTIGYKVAFEYLERNVNQISTFRANLGSYTNSADYSDKIDVMLAEALAEGYITQVNADAFKSSVESNLEWQEKHADDVDEWFENFALLTTVEQTSTTAEPTTITREPISTTTETISTATAEPTTTESSSPTTTQLSVTTTPGSANGVVLSSLAVSVWILVKIFN